MFRDHRSLPAAAAAAWIAFSLLASSHAADDIKVPFNFVWGESSARLVDSLARVQAKVVEKKQVGDRQCIVVEGIPQRLLQRALFYFRDDALNEVELHYGDPQWDSSRYAQFFDQTRRNIDAKYGTGRVTARQKTREGETLQTIIGYQWVRPSTSLQLYMFTAEQGPQAFRLLSLHYKGY